MATEKKNKKKDQAKVAKPKTAGTKKQREELSDEQLDKVSGGNANIASITFNKSGEQPRK